MRATQSGSKRAALAVPGVSIGVVSEPNERDLVYYDGTCGLCHGTVLFLLERDRDGDLFRFAPLQGDTFDAEVPPERRAGLPDSIVVQTTEGTLLSRSTGVIRLLRRLGGSWSFVAGLLWLVPKPLRDLGYRLVAATRRRLFKRPPGMCPLVPPELQDRFLP
jgi:predicted DCC family thiol-disulfide oxidoreductase YuxK